MPIELKVFSSETKLSNENHILRVKKYSQLNYTKETFPPKPPRDLYDLSSEDIREGEKRGMQPTLSVWESIIPRGHLFENRNITEEDLPAIYKLNVGDVHAIPVSVEMIPLEVHRDPISNIPSGHLHAGIQGLYRMRGISKSFYKNIKDELVQRSVLEDQSKKKMARD